MWLIATLRVIKQTQKDPKPGTENVSRVTAQSILADCQLICVTTSPLRVFLVAMRIESYSKIARVTGEP